MGRLHETGSGSGMRLPLLVGLFVLAATCAYPQQSQKTPAQKQPPTVESPPNRQLIAPERGTEKAPFVIQLLPAPKALVEKEPEAQEKQTPWTDWLFALFTGLLVVCTFLLAAIARSQRNDLRAIQRAYVSAEPGGLHPLWGDTRKEHWVIGYVKFRNGGRMPARNFRWHAMIACDENSLREDFPIPSVSEFEGTTVIAPGSVMKFGTPEIKLPDTGWIYVWGAYTYEDGFGRDQLARFCHHYNRSALRVDMDKTAPDSGYGIPADDGRIHRFGNTEKSEKRPAEPNPS
jgi:hypothetical protein